MHSVKRISLFAVMAAVLLSVGSAFAQKIGWVDGNEVLTSYDAAKQAETKIQAQSKTWQDSLQAMQKAAQDKADQYRKILSTMSDDAKSKAQAELDQLAQGIQAYQLAKFNQNDGELIKLRNDLLKPILDKVHNAIVSVAKKKKIDIVLDKASLVYPQTSAELTSNVVDLTPEVKAALK